MQDVSGERFLLTTSRNISDIMTFSSFIPPTKKSKSSIEIKNRFSDKIIF
jgi:hypothetical protein